jgi:alkanesulfonate monooxygenase SsuD/methylene tetrahydromethanopterin reductase-like flavin-dependent oxidoreductase (luciferase family)
MTFSFGIFDSFDLGNSTPGQVLASQLEFAVAAEAAGIGHYHVTEHHGTPLSVCPSPNLFLAALSQRTTRMRIGTLVNVLPAHHPLRLAEEIAILDQLSGGRLDLGVGSGVSPYELAYFGVEAGRAKPLFNEALEVITGALATGQMRSGGPLLPAVQAGLSVGPVQRPHPPLWYASSNTASAQWAAARNINFVGRWNSGAFIPAAEAYWAARRHRPDDGSPPPRLGVAAYVCIGDTDDAAAARFRKANDVFIGHLTKLWHDHGDHSPDPVWASDTVLAAGNAVIGSARTVRDQLIEQVRQAPVNYFEATLSFGDLTAEEARANLAAFADTVMPAVAEAAAAGMARS